MTDRTNPPATGATRGDDQTTERRGCKPASSPSASVPDLVEVFEPVSGAFLLDHARPPVQDKPQRSGEIFVDADGGVRIGIVENTLSQPLVPKPVGRKHSCCKADGRTRSTIDNMEEEEPLRTWPSFDLIRAFEHMEPHTSVPTAPSHMAVSVALFREISRRVNNNDGVILNNPWGSWRRWEDSGDELRLVGGRKGLEVGESVLDLDTLRKAFPVLQENTSDPVTATDRNDALDQESRCQAP